MTEDRFWEIVSKVGWGTEHTDYYRGKKILMEYLPDVGTMEEFRVHMGSTHNELYDVIDKWAKANDVHVGGDDSFGDLINHIIGMGRAETARVLKNPNLAGDRANASYGSNAGYKESFSYCIPYDDDYLPQEVKALSLVEGIKEHIERIDADVEQSKLYVITLGKRREKMELRLITAMNELKALKEASQ